MPGYVLRQSGKSWSWVVGWVVGRCGVLRWCLGLLRRGFAVEWAARVCVAGCVWWCGGVSWWAVVCV
eukprot:1512847-Alexandrium_andersonii.AAC.1